MYIGILLQWYYEKDRVQISVPGYVHTSFHSFQHKKSKGSQDSPYPWNQHIDQKDNQIMNNNKNLNNRMKIIKLTQ